jgi:ketosteroid isomerase-like protein
MNSESLRAWLESYRMAWETRDPDLVVTLFAQDATYQETPFTEPMRGREDIRRYWTRAVVSYQEQIRFGYEILAVTEVSSVAHWWASFVRISSKTPVCLDGVFLLAFDETGLCRELREWWVRKDH